MAVETAKKVSSRLGYNAFKETNDHAKNQSRYGCSRHIQNDGDPGSLNNNSGCCLSRTHILTRQIHLKGKA